MHELWTTKIARAAADVVSRRAFAAGRGASLLMGSGALHAARTSFAHLNRATRLGILFVCRSGTAAHTHD
jgi:hypothetical protein